MYFKLYKDLETKLDNLDNLDVNEIKILKTPEWIEDFRNKIKKMSQDNINDLYLLIRFNFLNQTDKDDEKELPYSAKKLKSSIKFDLEMMPEKLQKIIVLFVNENSKK